MFEMLNLFEYLLLISFGLSGIRAEYEIENVAPPVELGEGPHWDVSSNVLYYVDIQSQNIWKFDPETGSRTYVHLKNGPVGVAVPVNNTKDQFIAASGRDILLVKWDVNKNETDPQVRKLATVDEDRRDTRVNDGKCDPAGRFWIGTMGIEMNDSVQPNRGSLYRIGEDLTPTKIITPVTISNGLAWNRKKDTIYYIDSPTRRPVAFNYDLATGHLGDGRNILDLGDFRPDSIPDGMTIDADGHLWIALYRGSAVIQVDPANGMILRTIDIPYAPKITSVAFGGPQLDVLYVTSSRYEMSDKELELYPHSGSLFAIKGLGVRGLPQNTFKYRSAVNWDSFGPSAFQSDLWKSSF